MQITIHNLETDEIITREMTTEELAAHTKAESEIAKYEKAMAEKEKIRLSALSKLSALGLTEDEIAAL